MGMQKEYTLFFTQSPVCRHWSKCTEARVIRPNRLACTQAFRPFTKGLGFHFDSYDEETLTPVIRSEIKHAYVRNLGHYTVYLPAL